MFNLNTLTKYIFIIAFISVGSSLKAQQQGQYSQYMMNYFLVNPAAAGTEDNIDIKTGYRDQWTGVSGAPQNYYASAHIPINKTHANHRNLRKNKRADAYPVFGAMFSGQHIASIGHNTAYLSYAYHLPLTAKWIMSVGAMGGINQTTLGDLNFIDNQVDPAAGKTKIKPDMSLGVWLYSRHLFMGISSMQLLQGKLDFNDQSISQGVLNRHFYLTGGYNIQLNSDVKIVPSVLLRYTETAFQMDINAKARYRNICWGGLSYRRQDAVVLMAGVDIPLTQARKGSGFKGSGHGNNSYLQIGYSYDLGISKLSRYGNGSHEIVLGLILPTGGRVRSPSDYW
jgi:type IX secretion system PorP/SprF family membrane protein